MNDGNTSLLQRLDFGRHGGLSWEKEGPGMAHDTTGHSTRAGHNGGDGSSMPETESCQCPSHLGRGGFGRDILGRVRLGPVLLNPFSGLYFGMTTDLAAYGYGFRSLVVGEDLEALE